MRKMKSNTTIEKLDQLINTIEELKRSCLIDDDIIKKLTVIIDDIRLLISDLSFLNRYDI